MTLPAAGSAAPGHRERRSAHRRGGQLSTTSSPDLLGKHLQVGKLVIRTDVDHVKSCMFQSVAICTRTAYAVFALERTAPIDGADKEETMSTARTIKLGLAGGAALLMLSACVSPDEVSSLDSRVGALESRVNSMEAQASQLEAAASQCTSTCEQVQARTERMFQQSMTK
jgi:hypothetical protein